MKQFSLYVECKLFLCARKWDWTSYLVSHQLWLEHSLFPDLKWDIWTELRTGWCLAVGFDPAELPQESWNQIERIIINYRPESRRGLGCVWKIVIELKYKRLHETNGVDFILINTDAWETS